MYIYTCGTHAQAQTKATEERRRRSEEEGQTGGSKRRVKEEIKKEGQRGGAKRKAKEEVSEEIKLESFGRRAVLSLRQNLVGRIMDIEKDAIYQKYKERIGEVITAEVYQIWKREILLVDDDDNEVVMPR